VSKWNRGPVYITRPPVWEGQRISAENSNERRLFCAATGSNSFLYSSNAHDRKQLAAEKLWIHA